jgi:membrane protease YdiL (CAAX protease family)
LPLLVGAGICSGLLIWLLKPWVLVNGELAAFTRSIGLTQQSWPFFIVYFVLASPALEELFWRNFLGSSEKSPVLNDFWFAGYHLIVLAGIVQIGWLSVIFLVLAAAAWVWRQSNRLGGGLLPSYVSHLTADISIILVSYFLILRI